MSGCCCWKRVGEIPAPDWVRGSRKKGMGSFNKVAAVSFIAGTFVAGLGLAFFVPLFSIVIPILGVPVLAYGYAKYLDEIREKNHSDALKGSNMLLVGSSVAEQIGIQDEGLVHLDEHRQVSQNQSTTERAEPSQMEIEEIQTYELPTLLENLPADSYCRCERSSDLGRPVREF